MDIKVKFMGIDFWDREVFQNIENGKFYKREVGDKRFFTTDAFDGEPYYPLKEDVNVIIVNE